MAGGALIGPGVFVAVVGPSGAGKDTLLSLARTALAVDDRIVFARRVITRQSDASEDHDTLTTAGFATAEAAGAFALTWHSHGLDYGLPRGVDGDVQARRVVVANLSRDVLPAAKARYAICRTVLVTAPHDVLESRRAQRHRASDAGGDTSRRQREDLALLLGGDDLRIDNDGPVMTAAETLITYLRRLTR